MVSKNQINNSQSNKKSETEIKQNLNTIIDLLSELNQLESNQKDKITKESSYQFSDSSPALEINQEEKSTQTSTAHNSRNHKPKDNSLWGKETSFNSIPQTYKTNDNSINNKNSVPIAQNSHIKSKSVAILQQSVRNLEKKLKSNQDQLDEVMDSVNSLLSLTVELMSSQYNASSKVIVETVVPMIDNIIEQRSSQDQQRMGKALSKILPVAITQQSKSYSSVYC